MDPAQPEEEKKLDAIPQFYPAASVIVDDRGEDSSDCGDDNPGELLAIEQLRETNEAMKV